jgi:hypothetical protein
VNVQFPRESHVALSQILLGAHFGLVAQQFGSLEFVYAIWHTPAGQFLATVWLTVTHLRFPRHCCATQ